MNIKIERFEKTEYGFGFIADFYGTAYYFTIHFEDKRRYMHEDLLYFREKEHQCDMDYKDAYNKLRYMTGPDERNSIIWAGTIDDQRALKIKEQVDMLVDLSRKWIRAKCILQAVEENPYDPVGKRMDEKRGYDDEAACAAVGRSVVL